MTNKNEIQKNITEELVDPLYGLIRIGEPFASTLINPAIEKERKRLQGIKSLGLIFNQYPAGTHTKWEHYLGMFSVAGQISEGINKQEKEILQWLCLLGGFGHLPYTYVSALAVFLASMVSDNFKVRLREFIKPADSICAHCTDKKECETKPKELVLNSYDFQALRGSISAYKIKQIPQEVDFGHREKLIRGCFCGKDKLHKLYRAISRYDYLQRDLYHTGVAKFSIDFKQVFKTLEDGIDALEASIHMSLLDELYEYLVDILYLNPSIASLEALLSKVLAEKLCSEEIALEELIEFDDHAFTKKIEEVAGEDVVTSLIKRNPTFTIKRDIEVEKSNNKGNLKLEMELLGIRNKEKEELLSYHNTRGLTVSVYYWGESDNLNGLYRIMLSSLKGSKKFYPMAYSSYNLQRKYLPKRMSESLKLTQELASYAFGGEKITYNTDKNKMSLNRLGEYINTDKIESIVKSVKEVMSQVDIMSEEEYLNYRRIVMILRRYSRIKSSIKNKTELRQNLIRHIYNPMLTALLTLSPGTKLIRELWKPIADTIIEQIQDTSVDKSELIETLAYLSELMSEDKNKRIIGVLPSVIVTHNNEENEIDVLSISLMNKEVVLKLIECTKSDSIKKATDDYSKLLAIKNMIDSQRFQDLSVSTAVIGGSPVKKDFVSIEEMCQAVKNG